jgi:hypothetical protein
MLRLSGRERYPLPAKGRKQGSYVTQTRETDVCKHLRQLQADQDDANDSDSDGRIRDRAYEIYLERGQEDGHELDDWLQAERELDQESL